jgi:hypothetical protein
MSLAVGTKLGPYEILSPLGAGGMGEVFRARDAKLNRDVAIKVLPEAVAEDAERLARFQREAQVLASLNHPHIAAIYGLEKAGNLEALVLELVEGETLAEKIAAGPIPLDETLAIARQIADALEAAHEKGIVHRDLKPANVKVTPEGKVKVLDFGLAKAYAGESAGGSSADLSRSPTLLQAGTQAGIILGTAAYMSPEQARGKAVDKRADIWAFGAVVYEMLTGRKAFEGETVSDTLAAVLTREPDWSALPVGTPAGLQDLLRRCLDRDPRQRLRDIGDARLLLDRGPGIGEEAAPPAGLDRRSWLPLLSTAVVAGLLTAGAFRLLGPKAPSPAPLRKLDFIAPSLDLDWHVGPRLSPDGSRVAYSTANRIWVRDLDQTAAHSVADIATPGPLGWSPDSDTLVFADQKKLWRVPARGGAKVAIADIPGTGDILGAAWSRSGQVAFAIWRGDMYEVPAAGGVPSLLFAADPRTVVDFHYPSWLPNGDLLYLIHWKDASSGDRHAPDYLAVFDGVKQHPLSIDVGSADAAPTLAPRGLLLYLRQGQNAGIWAVPYDVEKRRKSGEPFLAAPAATSVSASEDGSLLYVEQSRSELVNEMVWMDRTGKTIGTVAANRTGLTRAVLSPDGRRIAFVAGPAGHGDIWVHDLDRGTETRLTFGDEDEEAPAWLSRSRIGYIQIMATSGGVRGRILAVNADGSGRPQMIAPEAPLGAALDALIPAEEGKCVLQIIDERGFGRLRVASLQPDGTLGPLRPILRVEPEPDVVEASVSPDGRLLAYVTHDPGQTAEMFLTRFPSAEGRWQVSAQPALLPRWARNGGELFFLSGAQKLMVASVRVDAAMEPPLVSNPEDHFVFDVGNVPGSSFLREFDFDVTRDGQRFLVVRPHAGSEARRMVLVQNWLAQFPQIEAR